MKKGKYLYIIALIFAVALLGFKNDIYFQINKSFDIFSNIYRLILENYVLEIDTETLVKGGIEGMLKTLDPYTEYFDEEDAEELEYFASGAYTGLGISVSVIDSQLTITGIRDDYPAYESGIKVGDRIFKIDTNFVLNISSEKLRDFTKGEQGTKLNMFVININNDTTQHILSRELIKMDNIPFYDIIDKNVAYIKLDRFTRTSASDLKKAIYELRKKITLKGLILDLRDNPGGLLDASVKVAELFLPSNSLIVTTKRRNSEKTGEFFTFNTPLEPDVPLCVLINDGSASASEIVAGAIQDYDRGIIVGKKSFGKGLVQSIFDVPYKGHLKMTTSKYYTPSGRCIQRLDFAEKYQGKVVKNASDTVEFRTKNGRKVYELTGILPDTIINNDINNPLIEELINNHVFFEFAGEFAKNNNSKDIELTKNDLLFDNFIKFVKKSDLKYSNSIFSSIANIKKELEKNVSAKKSLETVEVLESDIKESLIKDLMRYKSELLYIIKYEIYLRFYNETRIQKQSVMSDQLIKKSIELLLSENYKRLLNSNN